MAERRERLWDLPTRLFHWGLALLILLAWATAQAELWAIHKPIGYGVAWLLLFRLAWGIVGSESARFASFVKGPRAIASAALGFFSARAKPSPGHNALGALSVLAMLAVVALQVGTGFVLQDQDFVNSGPWAGAVSFETADAADRLHKLNVNILLALIGVHILTIAWYVVGKSDNLLGAMVGGTREVPPGIDWPRLRFVGLGRALLVAALAAALVTVAVLFPPR